MFVRWKRRERVSRKWGRVRRTGKFLLSAVLVCSERQDGKPRQKVLAYLGSIIEERIQTSGGRSGFWKGVDSRLASLNLDPAQRQRVEDALHSVVPRLTPEEERERREFLAQVMGASANPEGQA
jgi:hypothetical protein